MRWPACLLLAAWGCTFNSDRASEPSEVTVDVVTCFTAGDRFGVGEPCLGEGRCGPGKLECDGPYATRCSTEPHGSESAAETEVCNDEDDDCDGAVDEDFHVGEPCGLAAGCAGVKRCSEGAVVCLPDDAASGPDVCDGLDNNCDGYADYTATPQGLVSACACVTRPLSFSAPLDRSIGGDGKLCERTGCSTTDGRLEMAFCLDCEQEPYAMCVTEAGQDLTAFADGDLALTVSFDYESDGPAVTPVNLYFTVDYETAGKVRTQRRYLPLLAAGESPGSYTRHFLPTHVCYATDSKVKIGCAGEETDSCQHCRAHDSCGLSTGSECKLGTFKQAQLQLAVDYQACTGEFRGLVRVQDMFLGPLPCDEG